MFLIFKRPGIHIWCAKDTKTQLEKNVSNNLGGGGGGGGEGVQCAVVGMAGDP